MDRIIITFDMDKKDEFPSSYKKEIPTQSEAGETPRDTYVRQYKINNAEKIKAYAKEYYKKYAGEYYRNYAKMCYQKKKLNKLMEKEKEAKMKQELATKLDE